MRLTHTVSALAIIAAFAAPAHAQTGNTPVATAAPEPASPQRDTTAAPVAAPVPTGTQAPGGADAAPTGLGDIIVTAQRRSESTQRVAVPITAVSGAAVAALNDSRPEVLTQLAPALNVSQAAGAFSLFYLRGVGSFGGNSLSDSATAINFDGVYIARASSTYGLYYDLDRIEVLKGPQGTLYGRNATGGAINIVPNKPRAGELSSRFSADYGNYDALTLNAAINLPLGTRGALRVSGQTVDHDGYNADGTSDAKGRALRIQIGGQMTDRLYLRLAADFYHSGGRGPGATVRLPNGRYLGDDPRLGLESGAASAFFAGLPVRARPFILGRSRQDNDFFGINAEIAYETPVGTISIVPGIRWAQTDFLTNVPAFTINQREKDYESTVEAHIASNGSGPFQYIAGVQYLHEDIDTNGALSSQSAVGSLQHYTPVTNSIAGFARATYEVLPHLRLNGGIRYTSDRKRTRVVQDNDPRGPDASDFDYSARRSDNAFTYRGAVEFDLAPRSLLYASVETGFKAGGFTLAPAAPTYGDERITAYTVGSKNKLFGNRVLANAEAFWWDYRDQQYSHLGAVVLPNGGIIPAFVTDNVGDATIKGAELELQWLPFRDTLIGTQIQYLDARYDSFRFVTPNLAPVPVRPNVGPQCATTYVRPAVPGPGTQVVDCAGARLPFTSEWTVTLAAQQTIHLARGKLIANASGRYESGKYGGTEFLASQYQRGIVTADASLGYTFPGDRISVTGYVRNLTNRNVLAQTFVPFATDLFLAATVRPPRTYGVRLSVDF